MCLEFIIIFVPALYIDFDPERSERSFNNSDSSRATSLSVCACVLQDPYGSSSYIPVLPYGVEIPNRVFVGGISYSVRTRVCVGDENE